MPDQSPQDALTRLEKRVQYLEALIGQPEIGAHPDEWLPRGATWHAERKNWEAEVERLRAALRGRKP
jgi:hypothetical protein